jgi:GNAT superfamily N-acetyltransferase
MTTKLRIEPVVEALPDGFEALRAEARAEGYRHLDRLAAEWGDGTNRFNSDGEVFLAAFADGVMVAIGGLTIDPVEAGLLRLRRFYVAKAQRRCGIGRALADRLLQRARERQRRVNVNAATGSAPFWERSALRPMPATGIPMSWGRRTPAKEKAGPVAGPPPASYHCPRQDGRGDL